MTQEEKQLQFKDLCARLPYHVRVKVWLEDGDTEEGPLDLQHNYGDVLLDAFYYNKITKIRPYLRPMSSMTKKEMSELRQWGCLCMTPDGCVEDVGVYGAIHSIPVTDWLNSQHFDYRGLIEKGLALEAPEGMYQIQ